MINFPTNTNPNFTLEQDTVRVIGRDSRADADDCFRFLIFNFTHTFRLFYRIGVRVKKAVSVGTAVRVIEQQLGLGLAFYYPAQLNGIAFRFYELLHVYPVLFLGRPISKL